MSDSDSLDTLVSVWQQARAEGREPAVEELCRDCPEMAPRLAERIALLRQMSALGKNETDTLPNAGAAQSTDSIPTRIGDYHILTKLGQGGMGAVYWAEDERLRRPTAIKVLRPELAIRQGARERFIREARAAAAVEHAVLVPIWHVGEDRGIPYIAMPLLRGETLADRLTQAGALPVANVLQIGLDIANGLHAIHSAGMIHRDIKPANIWLTENDGGRSGTPFARILDFGLARLDDGDDPRLTGTGDILGTPAYMSPEQARSRNIDNRADLFSLGCVLYHAATGKAPFRAATVMDTLLAVANEQPPDPRTLATIPSGLDDLIKRLIAKNAEDRPASAIEVIRIIEEIRRERKIPVGKLEPTRAAGPPPVPKLRPPSIPVANAAASPSERVRPRRTPLRVMFGSALMLAMCGVVYFGFIHGRDSKSHIDAGGQAPIQGLTSLDPMEIPAAERYSWQSPELVSVVGTHSGLVATPNENTHVAISPNGRWIAWSSSNGVRIWDADTLRLHFHSNVRFPARPWFSPDSKWVVNGATRPEAATFGVNVVDLSAEPRIARGIGFQSGSPVTAIAASSDLKSIYIGRENGALQVWNGLKESTAAVGVIQGTESKPASPVKQLTLAGTDKKLISLSHDDVAKKATINGWTLTENAFSDPFTIPVSYELRRFGVTSDGDRIIIATPGRNDSDLAVWGIPNKSKAGMQKIFSERIAAANCIEAEIVGGSKTAGWHLWLNSGGSSAIWFLDLGPKKSRSISLLRDLSNQVLAVTPDQSRKVCLMPDGRLALQNSSGQEFNLGVTPLADSQHAPILLGGKLITFLPTPQVWQIQGGHFVPSTATVDPKFASGPLGRKIAVSPSGKSFAWLISGGVQVFTEDGEFVKSTASLAVANEAATFAWGTDDQTVRTAHKDGAILSWDLSKLSHRTVGRIPKVIEGREIALSSNGVDLFASTPGGWIQPQWHIKRFNISNPSAAPTALDGIAGPRSWPSPDGMRLAADDEVGLVILEVRGKDKPNRIRLPAKPNHVQWAEDNRHLMVVVEGLIYVLRTNP